MERVARRWRDGAAVGVIAAALGTYYIAVFAAASQSEWLAIISDDGFFFVQIARNIALGHGVTFDAIHPTTGVHPLWLWILAAMYAVLETLRLPWNNTHFLVPLAVAATLVFKLTAYVVLYGLVRNVTGVNRSAATALTVWAGLYFFSGSMLVETDVLLACMLVFLWVETQHKRTFFTSLFAALVILARIDYVIVLGVYAALHILCGAAEKTIFERMRAQLPLAIGAGAGVLLTSMFNYGVAGTVVSTSAALKSHAPAIGAQLSAETFAMFPVSDYVAAAALALSLIAAGPKQRAALRVGRPVLFITAGVFAFFFIHLLFNNLIQPWYYKPLRMALYLSAALAFIAATRDRIVREDAAGGNHMLELLVTAPLIIAVAVYWGTAYAARPSGAHVKTGKSAAYTFAVRAQPYCSGGKTLFAEDYSGTLAVYSSCRVVNGDGLVNAREYAREYLLTGRVAEYLRGERIDYYAITRWPAYDFNAAMQSGTVTDSVSPYFLRVPPSAITLDADNFITHVAQPETRNFFALFKLAH